MVTWADPEAAQPAGADSPRLGLQAADAAERGGLRDAGGGDRGEDSLERVPAGAVRGEPATDLGAQMLDAAAVNDGHVVVDHGRSLDADRAKFLHGDLHRDRAFKNLLRIITESGGTGWVPVVASKGAGAGERVGPDMAIGPYGQDGRPSAGRDRGRRSPGALGWAVAARPAPHRPAAGRTAAYRAACRPRR
jgi:hypothetical protein